MDNLPREEVDRALYGDMILGGPPGGSADVVDVDSPNATGSELGAMETSTVPETSEFETAPFGLGANV